MQDHPGQLVAADHPVGIDDHHPQYLPFHPVAIGLGGFEGRDHLSFQRLVAARRFGHRGSLGLDIIRRLVEGLGHALVGGVVVAFDLEAAFGKEFIVGIELDDDLVFAGFQLAQPFGELHRAVKLGAEFFIGQVRVAVSGHLVPRRDDIHRQVIFLQGSAGNRQGAGDQLHLAGLLVVVERRFQFIDKHFYRDFAGGGFSDRGRKALVKKCHAIDRIARLELGDHSGRIGWVDHPVGKGNFAGFLCKGAHQYPL